ncbi:hypothetical protein B0H11DRAFT_1927848 [Mycena galericulata]|nr:hypothetical protein B0H11DRAFT_1927848 [Mycena galericulata]
MYAAKDSDIARIMAGLWAIDAVLDDQSARYTTDSQPGSESRRRDGPGKYKYKRHSLLLLDILYIPLPRGRSRDAALLRIRSYPCAVKEFCRKGGMVECMLMTWIIVESNPTLMPLACTELPPGLPNWDAVPPGGPERTPNTAFVRRGLLQTSEIGGVGDRPPAFECGLNASGSISNSFRSIMFPFHLKSVLCLEYKVIRQPSSKTVRSGRLSRNVTCQVRVTFERKIFAPLREGL